MKAEKKPILKGGGLSGEFGRSQGRPRNRPRPASNRARNRRHTAHTTRHTPHGTRHTAHDTRRTAHGPLNSLGIYIGGAGRRQRTPPSAARANAQNAQKNAERAETGRQNTDNIGSEPCKILIYRICLGVHPNRPQASARAHTATPCGARFFLLSLLSLSLKHNK